MGAGVPGSVPRRPRRRSRRRDVRRLVSHPAASGFRHASGAHADRAEPVSVSPTRRARLLRPRRAVVSAGPPSHPAAHLRRQRDRPVAGRRAHADPQRQVATPPRKHAPRGRGAGHHGAATRRADAAGRRRLRPRRSARWRSASPSSTSRDSSRCRRIPPARSSTCSRTATGGDFQPGRRVRSSGIAVRPTAATAASASAKPCGHSSGGPASGPRRGIPHARMTCATPSRPRWFAGTCR